MEQQPRFGRHTATGIGLSAVVVDPDLGDDGQETDQVEPTGVEPGPDRRFRNVMPAGLDPSANPREMEFRRGPE